jgi:hypothetical protein
MANVFTPVITQVDFEYYTYIYPLHYYQFNRRKVTVHSRRFTIHATDPFGASRTIVGYYVNYDKINPANREVIFQVNGHFGTDPARPGPAELRRFLRGGPGQDRHAGLSFDHLRRP